MRSAVLPEFEEPIRQPVLFGTADTIKAFGNRAGDSFRCLTRRCVSSFFQVQTHVYRSTAITKSSTRPTASY